MSSTHTPPKTDNTASLHDVLLGQPITPAQRLLLMDADTWEEFLTEWGHFQKEKYFLFERFGGAEDRGVDAAGFHSQTLYKGEWDGFQCKHYKDPLTPTIALKDIGKLLWHIHIKNIPSSPSAYYFFAPKDCGPKLKKLLLEPDELKEQLIKKWDKLCSTSITTKEDIALDGSFFQFVKQFDFTIFKHKPVLEVIDEHSSTPYHSVRFGGGLNPRPAPPSVPDTPQDIETRYISQLNKAYAESVGEPYDMFSLAAHPKFHENFKRQRESFFSAEALKSFARDNVPQGTFENLQNEMYDGIIYTYETPHDNGYTRLLAVLKEAHHIQLTSNGLIPVLNVKDRHGICHQLVNKQKISWVQEDD